MTVAERLRAAADLIERTGTAATPGRWEAFPFARVWADVRVIDGLREQGVATCVEADFGACSPQDAAWIALLGPDTAPALAAWLRDDAAVIDRITAEGYTVVPNAPAVAFADLILRGQP